MPEPTYEDVYEPPILDSTFSDKMDELKAALSPQASGVHVSTANMHYITEDDAQGALAELDAEAYAINASLTQKAEIVRESVILSFSNGIATLNDKSGYTLIYIYAVNRPNDDTNAGYFIDGFIRLLNGNYHIHNSVSNLTAGLTCCAVWVKN